MDLTIFGYTLGALPAWMPAWAVPAAIVHLVMFAVLLVPAWVALARARAFGPLAILLILPVIGLIIVCARVMSAVLPYAGWSRAWGLLILIPGLNIFFLWLFAFAPWRRRYVPLAEDEETEQEPEERRSVRQEPSIGATSQEPPPADATMMAGAAARSTAPKRAPEPAEDSAPSPATMLAGSTPPPIGSKPAPVATPTIMPAPKGPRTLDLANAPAGKPAADEPATAHATPPAAAAGRQWRVVGANDIGAGIDLTLAESALREAEGGLLVGRSTRAHVIIEHDSISRNHARFALVNGVLYVEDLDSMNGSWLDGRKLDANRPAPLRPGSILEFGKVKLRVSAG